MTSPVRRLTSNFQVPSDCLIASMTTDGGTDERKGSSQLVMEGNDVYCCAHLIQLVIDDVLGTKKKAPPSCAPHRAVLKKSHDIVILINCHKYLYRAFSELAAKKIATEEGRKNISTLVIDNDTRWDSELAMLERLVYFDEEILSVCNNEAYSISPEVTLTAFELDLAAAMVEVLLPFRIFTKFVQSRATVTLAYIPEKIDALVSALAPGSFAAQLEGCRDGVLEATENFQECLVQSIKTRFSRFFEGESLALAAVMLLPGRHRLQFNHFEISEEVLATVQANMIDDLLGIGSPSPNEDILELRRRISLDSLLLARNLLDETDCNIDPLEWWPKNPDLSPLFPLAKMLFAIPASSAENERSFSSAGFILNQRRTQLDIDNFRSEHRIREFLTVGTDCHHQSGRKTRLERMDELLLHFSERVQSSLREDVV